MQTQWEEHLAHSWPCSSRFDGWDRGDRADEERDQGCRVEITEWWSGYDSAYTVSVDGVVVHDTEDQADAIGGARRRLQGEKYPAEVSTGVARPRRVTSMRVG